MLESFIGLRETSLVNSKFNQDIKKETVWCGAPLDNVIVPPYADLNLGFEYK